MLLRIVSVLLFFLPASLCSCLSAFAQESLVVTGKVTDEKGLPLPGVTVTYGDSNKGTTTNQNGEFRLTVPDNKREISFSYVGYREIKMPLGSRISFDVQLEPDIEKTMSDVVVVGYGTQKKASVVGAIGSVKGEDLIKSPTPNLTQALTGRIAGVTAIQTTGKPGSNAATILIRGQSTFGNSSAIVVVDGIERPDFGNIDPNEVESINVLKDASATAVYGIRGANGVIVVTTKRGTQGKPVVSYNGNFSLQKLAGMPDVLDAFNSATLKNEALANDGKALMFTDAELQKLKDKSDPVWYPDVNWYKEMVRNYFPQTQHNINVRGGSKIAQYYVSAGYLYEDGFTKDFGTPKGSRTVNNFSRYNFRSNVDLNVSKDAKISVTLGGVKGNAYSPGNTSFGDIGFVLGKMIQIPSYAMPVTLPGLGYTSAPSVGLNLISPIALIANDGFQINENNNIEAKIDLNYKLDKLTKGLSFRGTYAYDSYSLTITQSSNGYRTYDIIDRRNKISGISPQHETENYASNITTNTNGGNINTNIQLGFDYNRGFGKHNITAMALATRQARASIGSDAVRAIQGVVGRVTYNFDTRYFIEASVGYNGSENFMKGNRYGVFPAFAAGYTLSNEEFMKDIHWIDLLKIRGSYGTAGNDQIGGTRFLFLDDYTVSGNEQFGDNNSLVNYPRVVHSRVGNPDVTWEKTTKRNIGFEASFGHGLFNLTFDLFDDHRKDILVTNPQSRLNQYGEPYPAINVGEVKNKGYEIEVGHRNTIGEFTYGLNAQVSFARNRIINIDEPPGAPEQQKQAGKRIAQFFGYRVEGFYESAADIAASPVNTLGKVVPGDLKYEDVTGDGQINPDDRVPIGFSNRPEYNYSFSPSLAWRGLSLELLFQGQANVSSNVQLTENSPGQQMYSFMLDRWSPSKGGTSSWPTLHALGNAFVNYQPNDFLLQDASFLKLRNVRLSWRLPSRWSKSLGMSVFNVFVSGQNLYTWTPYRFGFDPEQGGTGNYPLPKVFNFGVNVRF